MWNDWQMKTRLPKVTILVAVLLPIVLFVDRASPPDRVAAPTPAKSLTDAANTLVAQREPRRETAAPAPKAMPEFVVKTPAPAPASTQFLPPRASAADGPAPAPAPERASAPVSPSPLPTASPIVPAPPAETPAQTAAVKPAETVPAATLPAAAPQVAKAARKASRARRHARRRGALGLLLLADEL